MCSIKPVYFFPELVIRFPKLLKKPLGFPSELVEVAELVEKFLVTCFCVLFAPPGCCILGIWGTSGFSCLRFSSTALFGIFGDFKDACDCDFVRFPEEVAVPDVGADSGAADPSVDFSPGEAVPSRFVVRGGPRLAIFNVSSPPKLGDFSSKFGESMNDSDAPAMLSRDARSLFTKSWTMSSTVLPPLMYWCSVMRFQTRNDNQLAEGPTTILLVLARLAFITYWFEYITNVSVCLERVNYQHNRSVLFACYHGINATFIRESKFNIFLWWNIRYPRFLFPQMPTLKAINIWPFGLLLSASIEKLYIMTNILVIKCIMQSHI